MTGRWADVQWAFNQHGVGMQFYQTIRDALLAGVNSEAHGGCVRGVSHQSEFRAGRSVYWFVILPRTGGRTRVVLRVSGASYAPTPPWLLRDNTVAAGPEEWGPVYRMNAAWWVGDTDEEPPAPNGFFDTNTRHKVQRNGRGFFNQNALIPVEGAASDFFHYALRNILRNVPMMSAE